MMAYLQCLTRAGTALIFLLGARSAAGQAVGPERIVVDATNILAQSMALQSGIPQKMLADAQGIAIMPSMVRGAFVFGVQYGRGVLLVRDANGVWQAPRMITITGGSVGYQIGVQSTDLILVFRTPQSVANVMKGTLKVGVDASAAAGPVGRQTSAATDLPMKAEILSYSRARGAFIGVSIDGSSISLDPAMDATYYQPPGVMPASAIQLLQMLTASANAASAAVMPPVQPMVAMGLPIAAGTTNDLETARQQLDAASRAMTPVLDDNWKRFLALPQEVYLPNQAASGPGIQDALARYDQASRQPQYAALAARPEFQATYACLRRYSELQAPVNRPLSLPPPPGAAPR